MDRRHATPLILAAAFAVVFGAGVLVAGLIGEPVTARVSGGAEAIGGLLGGRDDEEEEGRPPQPVRLVEPEQDTARDVYRAVGEVRARQAVAVTPPSPGIVDEIRVASGAEVEAGEVLIVLRRNEEAAAAEAGTAAVEAARDALARALSLADDGIVPQAQIDEERAALRAAEAELSRAEQALADRLVRAPFAGQVGLVTVDPGAFVTAGQELVTLATTRDLVLRFAVPPDVADALAPGDVVEVPAEGGTIEAVLQTVDPLTDAASRTVTVEAALSADAVTRPGSFATAEVVWQRRENALFVPASALVLDGQLAFVFVANDATAERRLVEPGEWRDEAVEILEGIAPGEAVIVEGQQDLEDGDPVEEARAP